MADKHGSSYQGGGNNPLSTQLQVLKNSFNNQLKCFSLFNVLFGAASALLFYIAIYRYGVWSKINKNDEDYDQLMKILYLQMAGYAIWTFGSALSFLGCCCTHHENGVIRIYQLFLVLPVILLITAYQLQGDCAILQTNDAAAQRNLYHTEIIYDVVAIAFLLLWSSWLACKVNNIEEKQAELEEISNNSTDRSLNHQESRL